MPIAIQLSADAQQVINRFHAFPRATQEGIRNGLAGALLVLEGKVRTGARLTWRRGAAGLAGRLTSWCKLEGPYGIKAAIGFRKTKGFPYELAQEFGAHAKAGGAMAIPVSPMAKTHSNRGLGPRQFPKKLVLVSRHDKPPLLIEALARSSKIHYVLVKSIPPRLNFRMTVRTNLPLIERGILRGLRQGRAA